MAETVIDRQMKDLIFSMAVALDTSDHDFIYDEIVSLLERTYEEMELTPEP
jgi:hypothetical protein